MYSLETSNMTVLGLSIETGRLGVSSMGMGIWIQLLGFMCMNLGGSVRMLTGMFLVGLGGSISVGVWSLGLLLMLGAIGMLVVCYLLRLFVLSGSDNSGLSGLQLTVITIVLIQGMLVGDLPAIETDLPCYVYVSSALRSWCMMLILCHLLWVCTIILVRMTPKKSVYNVRYILSFLLVDIMVLLLVGSLMMVLSSLIRKGLSSNVYTSMRERIFRSTGSVYECGIAVVPSTYSGSSEYNVGMMNIVGYVYLFVLLDLESCVILTGYFGMGGVMLMIMFIMYVLLSMSYELDKLV